MSVYFSSKFKQLRKACDLTQEQIAEIFHVSPQSVSRWETGVNYPDVETLPHMAGFFKVTVDELLGTERILGEKKATVHQRDIRNLLNTGRLSEAIGLARRAVKEYPVNYQLQGLLIQALCVTKENAEAFQEEIIATGQRVISYCADQNTCLWVKYMLLRQYVKWGVTEEAKQVLEALPSEVWYTQEVNKGEVLEGDEWQENQQFRIIRFSTLLCEFLSAYARKAELPPLEKIRWMKTAMQVERLISPIEGDCDNEDHIYSSHQRIFIAACYCEAGCVEEALDYTEQAVQDAMHHLDKMDQTNESGLNYYPWPTPRNLCWILWEDHLMKPQFDGIRNSKRFAACVALLQEHSHELTQAAAAPLEC